MAYSPDEIETLDELAPHVRRGSLDGLTLQGLDLTGVDLGEVSLTGTLFVGCAFGGREDAAELMRRGADVIPVFPDAPFLAHPGLLYTADDLADGFAEGGFDGMYDTVVYRHFVKQGGATPDVRTALAQRLHDSGIDNALGEAMAEWRATSGGPVVGVMGGHSEQRGTSGYLLAARIGQRLTQQGCLIVTGGGPGVMEAANLGSYLVDGDLDRAIATLATAPDFRDHDRYTKIALEVRAQNSSVSGGLAIPTWLYGHEPANLFAGKIAKYFSNALREDVILRLSRGGIVFAPGKAGTVQEVFQAATKTFYTTDGPSGPFVFLDRHYWTDGVAAPQLLRDLLAKSPAGDLSGLVHVTDDIDEAVSVITAGAVPV
ncbi:LOG family protein [Longispora albida]|uniref:LOG family protein n=1 Tax=Longispora albida TaxID=203523 RepID=UPI0003630AE8|nr:hypothetical protein [Longispora albida]